MIFHTEELHKRISLVLATIYCAIGIENKFTCFDSNRYAQEYFCGLLGFLGFSNLEELDQKFSRSNYPAIDIEGDDSLGNKIAFQVTTSATTEKIQDTIRVYSANNFQSSHHRLVFLFIQNKPHKKITIKKNPSFPFDLDKDIYYLEDIISLIKALDDEALGKLNEFLDKKTPDLTRILSLISFEKLESSLEHIFHYLFPSGKTDLSIGGNVDLIPDRDEGFIERKNEVNKIEQETYHRKIEPDIHYGIVFSEFLSNGNMQNTIRYYVCKEEINSRLANGDKQILEIFKDIIHSVSYSDEANFQIISVFLHNMYHGCDIGTLPQTR